MDLTKYLGVLRNSFAETAIPLILGWSTLAIDGFAQSPGLALFFNMILLVTGVYLISRFSWFVIKTRKLNWKSIFLALLGFAMPLLAIANILETLAPFLQLSSVKDAGYIIVVIVISVNFLSLAASADFNKRHKKTFKEVKVNENRKKNIFGSVDNTASASSG